jgi:hypothetical protein
MNDLNIMASAQHETFLYTGQPREDIPRGVTHVKVRVDPAVKVVGSLAFASCLQLIDVELCKGLERIEQAAFVNCNSLESVTIPSTVKGIYFTAFSHCSLLRRVELNEGLEKIGDWAFGNCRSLTSIAIPSTVKEIGLHAFCKCRQLRNMELCEGLELINYGAFEGCSLLESVRIPSTVKAIEIGTFFGCHHLRNVELCEGLERIDHRAFHDCTSLTGIRIPSTVKRIRRDAFKGCTSLITIKFCAEMDQFVNEVSLPWWNHGVSEVSLETYSFFARCNIPARLDTIKFQTWKINIHDMLQKIPTMIPPRKDWEHDDDNDFASIDSQLAKYQHLQGVAPLLELVLWKSKILEQSNGNLLDERMKLQCRFDSLSMVSIVIPNALSFL